MSAHFPIIVVNVGSIGGWERGRIWISFRLELTCSGRRVFGRRLDWLGGSSKCYPHSRHETNPLLTAFFRTCYSYGFLIHISSIAWTSICFRRLYRSDNYRRYRLDHSILVDHISHTWNVRVWPILHRLLQSTSWRLSPSVSTGGFWGAVVYRAILKMVLLPLNLTILEKTLKSFYYLRVLNKKWFTVRYNRSFIS